MLNLTNVSKSYGKKKVLDNININFDNNYGVYGLLGRNGVGKTTLLKIISNMVVSYNGSIQYSGHSTHDNGEVLSQIFYLGAPIVPTNILFSKKIKYILSYYQMLYENFDYNLADNLLTDFNIRLKDRYRKLSTGNQTLVQNILALASRAPITLMDEPTNGLDSVNREFFFRKMMEDYQEHPRMFILSTHLIQEIEGYLTDVVILKDNQVLLAETMEDIQRKSFRIKNYPLEDKNIIHQEQFGGLVTQDIYEPLSDSEQREIQKNGGEITYLDLQTLFNHLVGGNNHGKNN